MDPSPPGTGLAWLGLSTYYQNWVHFTDLGPDGDKMEIICEEDLMCNDKECQVGRIASVHTVTIHFVLLCCGQERPPACPAVPGVGEEGGCYCAPAVALCLAGEMCDPGNSTCGPPPPPCGPVPDVASPAGCVCNTSDTETYCQPEQVRPWPCNDRMMLCLDVRGGG